MSEESLPYRHGIHEAMGVLAGQWVTAVLASLTARPMTYSKLLEHINRTEERLGWVTHERPLRQKVLTDTLHRMQRDGLVVKIDRPSTFGSTWYQLTPWAARCCGRCCRWRSGRRTTAPTSGRPAPPIWPPGWTPKLAVSLLAEEAQADAASCHQAPDDRQDHPRPDGVFSNQLFTLASRGVTRSASTSRTPSSTSAGRIITRQ